MYTVICLFIHSLMIHLGCLYLLDIVNYAAMNIHVQIFEYLFSVILGVYLKVEMLHHIAILCLSYEEPSHCFPQ
jgi:hypothetical protein